VADNIGCWYAALQTWLHTNNGLGYRNTMDDYQQRPQQHGLEHYEEQRTNHNILIFYFFIRLEHYEEQSS
jgi:hypothetical protein